MTKPTTKTSYGKTNLGVVTAKSPTTVAPIIEVENSPSNSLRLTNVRENNLKNISLTIPHNSLTVISGVSGSGKSTLAFDTIYAEGGRRYIETFSPYTRQFLDRLQRPDLDNIEGVRPALALEQRNRITSSRSTVGTSTEINDYLKIIWSQLGEPHCPGCATVISRSNASSTVKDIERTIEKIATPSAAAKNAPSAAMTLLVCFSLPLSGSASIDSVCQTLIAQGFLRYFCPVASEVKRLEELSTSEADLINDKELIVVVDRIKLQDSSNSAIKFTLDNRQQLLQSITQAFAFGHGTLSLVVFSNTLAKPQTYYFSEGLHCPDCDISLALPKPSLFTFNSPLGACSQCHGFGKVLVLDRVLCIPDPNKSINDGALVCWSTPATAVEFRKLKVFCAEQKISLDTAWGKLTQEQQELVFSGPAKPLKSKGVKSPKSNYKGVTGWFNKLQRKRHRMHIRVFISRYRSEITCPECSGTRLKEQALNYKVLEKTLPEIWQLTLDCALDTFRSLSSRFQAQPRSPASTALEEVISRLSYLNEIGLDYLTLDRQSRTLSGGESQRVNLTSILGSRLVNTTLVLDEPTIGLHSRDTERLIETLHRLKNIGNTVVVVEHDSEVIRSADRVVDLGPEAGSSGGEIVFAGPASQLANCSASLTGQYLSGKRSISKQTSTKPRRQKIPKQKTPKQKNLSSLGIRSATAHNLQQLDVDLPLNGLTVISGVSGSGKSTLITKCLYQPYQRLRQGLTLKQLRQLPDSTVNDILGLEQIDDIILIDQSALGKSPRSNPATYTKAWDLIRQSLAETEAAVGLGLSKAAFSFNVDGGRCSTCKGVGQVRIEMQFLADVFVQCESCGGARFQDKVLGVRYAGKNVLDLLSMSLSDAHQLFAAQSDDPRSTKILACLSPLLALGLGYLRLGQPLNAVSGGEAQRIKLAAYLGDQSQRSANGKLQKPKLQKSGAKSKQPQYLFILDEPTTGLHPHNIADLLSTFNQLIEKGHSVLCIEHNLDLIATADWLIDMGPDGGSAGGQIVAQGTPAELASDSEAQKRSYTSALLAQHFKQSSKVAVGKASEKKAITVPRQAASSKLETSTPCDHKQITITGARHHNLKNVSATVDHRKLTVITGVSGSGKSTLAFDILFAEGQRRYIDCLSPYARQYIKQLSRADVDLVSAIAPTIAVSQKTAPPMGVSTIATTTELYQFLRLLYSKLGQQHCTADDTAITSLSSDSISDEIAKRFAKKRVLIFAPVVSGRKGYYTELFNRALRAEITQAKIDGSLVSLEEDLRLERHKLHWISLAIASISNPTPEHPLLRSAVEQCLLLGNGVVEAYHNDCYGEPQIFSIDRVCPKCGTGYRELDPQDFSFRSARGICNTCQGRGKLDDASCPSCLGARIGAVGRHVYLDGKQINELTALNAKELFEFISKLDFGQRLAPIAEPIICELKSRLQVIIDVGLDYIQLDRDAHSISGGEAQRLRLARSLGSPLTGVCYVLDEPSIGLHPRDHQQLMDTLFALRDQGNTVVVVEHDEETILQADRIIDVGPGGGANGGRIVACGTVDEIIDCPQSITGRELRQRRDGETPTFRSNIIANTTAPAWLELRGASANNLRSIDLRLPIGQLTVVVGVSGAGKSSLVHSTLIPAIIEEFEGEKERSKYYPKTWQTLAGHDCIERFIEIDQTPIGRTPTSTPASFLGIFDEIRKIYALLPEAQARGWKASHFSFNTGKGRCPDCQGRGVIRVPMSFLPEATTTCESCLGLRYNEETLELLYQGISIGQLLQKTCSEARAILANHSKITRSLNYVLDLGLGYMCLGQPTHTLSGGEAQRVKIARELGLREAQNTIYVLDEPTIGLHMSDVLKLRQVLQSLLDRGNTVVVVEHNLDIIGSADYLVELGPGPGEAGGQLLFQGTPEQLRRSPIKTPTKEFLLPPPDKQRGKKLGKQQRINDDYALNPGV